MNLQTQDISLAAAQEKVLRQMLDDQKKQGIIKSDVEYNLILQNYKAQIQDGSPIMKIPSNDTDAQTNSGTIAISDTSTLFLVDGNQMTETMEEFEIDVMTSFAAINAIGNTVTKHKLLNQSVLNGIQLDLKKQQDLLDQYESMIGINGVQSSYIQRFHDSDSLALWETDLFVDRTLEVLDADYECSLDVNMESLKLPAISSDNMLIGKSGVHLAKIAVTKQLGAGLVRYRNPQYSIDNAIDESMETFWSETILTDNPLQVEEEIPYKSKIDGDQVIKINFGALSILEIDFDYLTSLTQISLTPYAEFPMTLLAVLYYDEEEKDWYSIISPSENDPGLLPIHFTDTISFEFNAISTKRMQVILNQMHFIKNDQIISEKQERNLSMWFQATSTSSLDLPASYQNKPTYQDVLEENPVWGFFLSEMESKKMDLDQIMKDFNQDQTISLSKYEYDYGLYSITAQQNEYSNRGMYVSKPIPIDAQIRAVHLMTDEFHPYVSEFGRSVTDIEYSITNGLSWNPILPLGKETIECELLIPKETTSDGTTCRLRFVPDPSSIVVTCVGGTTSTLTLGTDYRMGSMSPQEVLLYGYDVSAIYTVSYKPINNRDAYLIDFLAPYVGSDGTVDLDTMPRNIETFDGTDANGYVTLSCRPFIDKQRLNTAQPTWSPTYLQNTYLPIVASFVDQNGNRITMPNVPPNKLNFIENVTDYYDPENTNNLETFDATKMNYQFQVFDNQIQFNTPLPKGCHITIEYPYLVKELRLQAVMRRNSHGYQGLTPVLNEYTLSFETMS